MMNHPIVRKFFHLWALCRRPMTLGVRVLVEDETGSILLVRHTYVDGWHFPGGGVERNESQVEAAHKELREETGIECTGNMKLIGVYWNRGASKRDHVSLFRCEKWNQKSEFEPNMEISEIRFFHPDQLPTDVTPGTRRRINETFGSQTPSDIW